MSERQGFAWDLTEVESEAFFFKINPPSYSPQAPVVNGKVHPFDGNGIVNFECRGQCFSLTIPEMRAIIRKWDERKKV
jgi:hypothetical protein